MDYQMRLNEVHTFVAQPKLGADNASFVHTPTWDIGDAQVLNVEAWGAGQASADIRATKIGTSTLKVSSDGVSSDVWNVTVVPPFDSIVLSASKKS